MHISKELSLFFHVISIYAAFKPKNGIAMASQNLRRNDLHTFLKWRELYNVENRLNTFNVKFRTFRHS